MHPRCVVCSASNGHGLQLDFRLREDGTVRASFDCARAYEGYTGYLHGGVISALLDGAMTNCLFAHGYCAVTAELRVRFLAPVSTKRRALVRAWVEQSLPLLHILGAQITQDNEVKAMATGKFMQTHHVAKKAASPRDERSDRVAPGVHRKGNPGALASGGGEARD